VARNTALYRFGVRVVPQAPALYGFEKADFASSPPLNVGNAMRLIKVWTHALHEHAENANAVLDDELDDGLLLLQQIYAIQEGARVIDTLSSQARDMLQQEVWERTDESGAPEDEHLNVTLAVSKTLSKHTHDLPTVGQIETDIQGASREQIYDILSRINSTLPTKMEHTPSREMLTEGVYEKFLGHLKSQRDN
jgi:hypothetical protein